MGDTGVLIAVAVLLPFVAGVLCYALRNSAIRSAIVVATAIALIIDSVLLLQGGAGEFTPGLIAGVSWGLVITIADLLLMVYFLYLGVVRKSLLVIGLALAQLLPLAYFEFIMGASTEVEPAFFIDWLTITMVLIISIIGSIIVAYAIPYMRDHEQHKHIEKSRQPRFFLFLVLFLGAMNGLVMSNNLFWLYFFWEMTTLCCVMLIGHDGTEEALTNAYRALWMNLIGGVGFVAAIILLYTQAHTLSMQKMLEGGIAPEVMLLPVAFLCLAGFTKSAQMPFQPWLLGAMVAPTPVSALLHSSTMVKAGVYLIVRFAPVYQGTNVSTMVALVGAFTFLAAAALAISQRNGKRVLAYSTISNLGLIIACAGINTPLALTAAVMLIIFHAVSKALLFMGAGVIEHGIWSREIEDMEGLLSKMPLTTALMIVGILSMLLPPFGVLIAKWAAIEASTTMPLVMLLIVGGSALTVVFWAKFMGRLLTTGPGVGGFKIEPLHFLYAAPLVALAAGAAILSAFITPITSDLVAPAVIKYYQAWGFATPDYGLVSAVGAFPVWPIFVILGLLLVLPALFVRVKAQDLRPAYMCGENVGEMSAVSFRTVSDEPQEMKFGGYYFDRFFGEGNLNRWFIPIATALIALVFAVAVYGMVYL
jgi:ech hydrogenase subunit A